MNHVNWQEPQKFRTYSKKLSRVVLVKNEIDGGFSYSVLELFRLTPTEDLRAGSTVPLKPFSGAFSINCPLERMQAHAFDPFDYVAWAEVE